VFSEANELGLFCTSSKNGKTNVASYTFTSDGVAVGSANGSKEAMCWLSGYRFGSMDEMDIPDEVEEDCSAEA
jgi:hypothetical protein